MGGLVGGLLGGLGESSQSSNQQTQQNTQTNENVSQQQGQNVTQGTVGTQQGTQSQQSWQDMLSGMLSGTNQNQQNTTTGSTTGQQQQTGTQTQNPWEVQAPFLQDLWNQAQGAQGWRDNSQAGATMQQGWNTMLDYAGGGLNDIFNNAQSSLNFLGNQENLLPENNPFLQGNLDAMTRQVQESLGQGLNQVNQSAIGAGQFGGSRQGVAQAQAIQAANNTVADQASQMLMQNYNAGQDRMLQAAQLSPMLAELGLMPGNLQQNVGQQQSQWENPWEDLGALSSIVQAGNWGGTTQTDQTTQSNEQQQQVQDMISQMEQWQQQQQQTTGGSETQTQQTTTEIMQRLMDAWMERQTESETNSQGTQSGSQTNKASPLDMFAAFMGAF